jgi:hypothetical protein
MNKATPSSVTAEEAVARMVNMDYIPEGFTLEEMLAAFCEEAEVEYENAQIDSLPADQIEALRVRVDATKARLSLALLLLEDLREGSRNTQGTTIVLSQDSSSKPRYTLESVSEWAAFKYGIGIPEWSSDPDSFSTSSDVPVDVTWEDIEIRIRKDNKIAYSHTKGKWKEKTFGEIGLLNRKEQIPNRHAVILIGISHGKKFPTSSTLYNKDNNKDSNKAKTAISKLRTSLKALTGIANDPFTMFNKADGWKPRFKLTDDRNNADRRAENAAIHEVYDDTKNYNDENDAAGIWLENNK